MITLKLNLLNLKCQVKRMKAVSGEIDCLVIPIDKNSLFKGEKGIYLDMIAFEIKNKEDNNDTHIIKQSFPKDVRDKMTEDELRVLPILGNMRIWSDKFESESVSNPEPQPESDDLPF